MKVILLQDVPGTGKKEDIVNVSDGFARNYLFPKKWAVEAKPGAMKEIERKKAAEAERERQRRMEAEARAALLKGKTVTLAVKCGGQGRLYGSVTAQEVADALLAQHGVEVDKRKIDLGDPIRQVGDVTMTVTVYSGIKTTMNLHVVAAEK